MSREQLRRGLYDLFVDLYNQEAFSRRKREYMQLMRNLRHPEGRRPGHSEGASDVL